MRDNILVDFCVIGSLAPGNYDWNQNGTPKTGIVDYTPRLVIGKERWMEAFRMGVTDSLSADYLVGYGAHDGAFTTKGAHSYGRMQVMGGKVYGRFRLDCKLDVGRLANTSCFESRTKGMVGTLVETMAHPMLRSYDDAFNEFKWERADVTASSPSFSSSLHLGFGMDTEVFFGDLNSFLGWVCEREAKR